MVTVRDLLGELDGLRLLAGQDAIDVPVRWVHITELKDPTPWLSGGELLLTTGMQLDTPQRQREFVERLASHRLAGLGFGTGFGHSEVPPALLEAARECEFPVFEVPYETPFIAVTEAAFTRLVNEQYAVLRRALAAHERLERVVLSEQGLEALAGTLATLIGAAVLICDARGRVLASHAFRRTLDPETVQALREELAQRRGGHDTGPPRRARAFLPAHAELADRALALPVAAETGALAAAPSANGSAAERADGSGLAGRDQGLRAAVGFRPAHVASGGDDRRARAAAGARRRRHRAPAGRRPAVGDRQRGPVRAGAHPAACAVRAGRHARRDRRPPRRRPTRSPGAARG